MEKKLQTLIFPDNEKVQRQWGIYYRGNRCVQGKDDVKLYIPAFEVIDFSTFFNGFSYRKWKTYTNLGALHLYIEMKGNFDVELVGYDYHGIQPERRSYATYHYELDKKETVCIAFPDECKEQMVAFEIHPYADCELYGGYYTGEYMESDVREVELALATTTCFKEEYIIHNMELLKNEILESDDEISRHFYIHVVDNGRTLEPEKYNCDRLTVHPNKNVGGSGGFARGMIESLHQEPKATHVLLMDDDVIILPESLKRTYTLLTLLKPEHQGKFIAGAVLAMEDMCVMHEDLGTVRADGEVCPVHRDLNVTELVNCLKLEEKRPKVRNEFGAWWYCCMPREAIEKNGLPLPIFIRSDDLEYGLRCHPGFITMNGICLWHMGFTNKFNPAIDLYQVYRNMLVIQATSGVCQGIDFMAWIKRLYKQMMLEFNYGSVELLLRALEDYMKGPEFLMEDRGEAILKENRKLVETLVPIEKFEDDSFKDIDIHMDRVYETGVRSFKERWIYRITYNGHRFWPKSRLKDKPGVIGYDWSYQPDKQNLRRSLIVVNPLQQTMGVRTIDRDRFKKLQKRFKHDLKEYYQRKERLSKAYADAYKTFTSEKFWKKYLAI